MDLAYDLITPEDGNKTDKPLVIIHGLFGSKRNWSSVSKSFARTLKRPVYTLDLRNHGVSPHARPMTYPAMAADVLHFFKKHNLTNVALLGHSMGGKVAMTAALSLPSSSPYLPPSSKSLKPSPSPSSSHSPSSSTQEVLSHLIIEDIAPSNGRLSPEFYEYVRLMTKVNNDGVKTRKEADAVLAIYEKDESVRQFLLTNFTPGTESEPGQFKLPMDILQEHTDDLGKFEVGKGRRWEGKTLFVKGEKSRFLNPKNIPLAHQFFPNLDLVSLIAGHWVHAEKPGEFMKEVGEFLEKDS